MHTAQKIMNAAAVLEAELTAHVPGTANTALFSKRPLILQQNLKLRLHRVRVSFSVAVSSWRMGCKTP
jgi:hypothetical protein